MIIPAEEEHMCGKMLCTCVFGQRGWSEGAQVPGVAEMPRGELFKNKWRKLTALLGKDFPRTHLKPVKTYALRIRDGGDRDQ